MKVLLTGATGFVGSHILELLLARRLTVRVLLRRTSNRRFIEPLLAQVESSEGGIDDTADLDRAMEGVTHVIHCAGATKARCDAEFYQINQAGTRNVVWAINRQRRRILRLVHISSLAASHPATANSPAREDDVSAPVSEYGKSKMASEQEILNHCDVPFSILRPPAVYGPRDEAFLPLFKSVRRHLLPKFSGGAKAFSVVFVRDLAEGVLACLMHPAAEGRIYFIASPEIPTDQGFNREIAHQLNVWTLPLWLPVPALWPICAFTELACRLMNQPSFLNRQKYQDLRAPGWVCDASRLRAETSFVAGTSLADGIRETIAWYRENKWL